MKTGVKEISIDSYINSQQEVVQPYLQQIRELIRNAAPKATEVISYNMPAFKVNGVLVYFAACKNHLGFYPSGKVTTLFSKELKAYKCSKGAIQFPYNKPLPAALIKRIVKFRLAEDKTAAALKEAKKAGKK